MSSTLRPLGFVIAFAVAVGIGWFILRSDTNDLTQPGTVSTDPAQVGATPN